ncbi:MAG: hypothetical protein ACYCPS_00305 [Candidatus Saccharimonadales bacterium]
MTLVKPKNKVTVNQRKMSAGHHRKNKHYLKPYWPYLPIILILGSAFIANDYLPASFNTKVASRSTARINSVIGSHNSVVLALMTIVLGVMVMWFVIRHLKILKRLVFKGEQMLARNFMLDILVALVIAGMYVMIR